MLFLLDTELLTLQKGINIVEANNGNNDKTHKLVIQ